MSAEQQEFLQWISEKCKYLGASPEMHDEMQALASRVDLTPANGSQFAITPKILDEKCLTILAGVQK